MKKRIFTSCVILSAIAFFSGCQDTGAGGSNTNKNLSILKISDYYPFLQNVKYTYSGSGNEYASYYCFTDYIEGDRAQIRTNNGGTETVSVLENKDGALTRLDSKSECYYRENFLKLQTVGGDIILKEPIIKGTSWETQDNSKRTITNVDVMITTNAGNFQTIEVTTQRPNSKTVDYYAPNTGLVKTVYSSEGYEVSSTLEKIQKDIPFTQSVRFYYPDLELNKIYYTDKPLFFNTNDVTRQIFENKYKELPSTTVSKVLGPDVKINSLYLNPDGRVYIDFSKELITQANATSSYESMMLKCIANTFGGYYGVNKVYITVDGAPYSSKNIHSKPGESVDVDTKSAVKLK